MQKIKDNATQCTDCNIEFADNEWNGDSCPKCGGNSLEDVNTNEYNSMNEEERLQYEQDLEDNATYNSNRLSH